VVYNLEGTIPSSGWASDIMMQAGISLALGELALDSFYVSSTILRLDIVWKSQDILEREAFETRRWSVWLVNSNDNHWSAVGLLRLRLVVLRQGLSVRVAVLGVLAVPAGLGVLALLRGHMVGKLLLRAIGEWLGGVSAWSAEEMFSDGEL
jgi:hypothetical protein